MKLLIIGGYGVFGGRLAQLLSDCPDLTLLIAGRNQTKAESFCAAYEGRAQAIPFTLNRENIAQALIQESPDIVIDASGPFQDYGDDPYLVPKACIAHRVDYLDFADAADFVFGISELDKAAKDAGVTILSGVSSFPVLTAAVLRKLGKDITIESVKGGIAPSPYAGIGLNVMKAVVGYAGGPVKLTRHGRSYEAKGLAESLRYTIAPPGFLPLKNLHFSLVDVPDLQVLPQTYPEIQDIWMGAGPIPEILHRMLNVLAKARAVFRLPSWEPFAPFFFWVLNKMKFGEHRGGMFVEVEGRRNGQPVTRSWHLLAEGDDGPYIPSMAIEAIIRKWLKGERPSLGARSAIDALETEDYEALFNKRNIHTGYRHDAGHTTFRTILGEEFEALPASLKSLHDAGSAIWAGEASVKTGRNPLAKFIGLCVGINIKSGEMPLRVMFTETDNGQIWKREFGDRSFKSVFALGKGRNAYLATERFGIVKVAMALVPKDGRLYYIPRRLTVLGIPLPHFMVPKGESFETEKNGRFHFNVTLKLPFLGLLAAYKGWLEPVK